MKWICTVLLVFLAVVGCSPLDSADVVGGSDTRVAGDTATGDAWVEDGVFPEDMGELEEGEGVVAAEVAEELPPPPCVEDAECNDLDPCTVDKCEEGFGCVNTPKLCSDENECTVDLCRPSDGKCEHETIECADDNACTEESCDPAVGCVFSALDCDDGMACTSDGCNPVTGCANKEKTCDDGNPCTDDTCSEPDGCAHTPSLDPNCCVADFQCDDELPCTLDACTAYTCTHEPIVGLTCCESDGDCADENECTENLCIEGLCQLFAAGPGCCMEEGDCNDGDGCTTDSCLDHFCQFEPVPGCCHEDVECDDAEVCTEDVCAMAGGDFGFCENKEILDCCHGEDLECDDGNLCTVDTCPGVGDICLHEWEENCCLSIEDCNDGEPCTVDSCLENQCGHVDVCCYGDEDCDDGDDVCTNESCVNNFCVYEPTGAPGCCNIPLLTDDFSTNQGWDYGPTWERAPTSMGAGHAYGNADPALDHTGSDDNFVAGVVVGGNAPTDVHEQYYLTSPPVNAAMADSLTFSYRRWLNSDYDPYMINVVEAFDGATWVELWKSGSSPGIQDPEWVYQEFDVTPHANAQFRVRFGYLIGSAGVFTVSQWNVDDVKIFAGTGALCCQWASDCQTEENPDADCLAGICFSGECTIPEQCDDFDECTTDACEMGGCVYEKVPDCCNVVDDCVDAPGVCHTASCEEMVCSYLPIDDCCEEDGECQDEDICTEDLCVENECVFPDIAGCCEDKADSEDQNDCTTDSCFDNQCLNEPIPDCCLIDDECDDQNDCTTDTCFDGACLNEPIPDCCLIDDECDDQDDCTTDTCIGNSCSWEAIPDCP